MNNAKEMQAAYRQYRDSLYADYPQVKQFEDKKRKLLKFLLLYLLLLNLAKTWAYCSYNGTGGLSPVFLLVGMLVGMAPTMIFLLAAMTPKWKIALVLYFPPFQFFGQLFLTLARRETGEIQRFIHAYVSGFSQHPFIISLDILSWISILLILGTAIWLTLIPGNRRLSEQSDILTEQLKKYMLSHPVQ